jgi:hypothetical protein
LVKFGGTSKIPLNPPLEKGEEATLTHALCEGGQGRLSSCNQIAVVSISPSLSPSLRSVKSIPSIIPANVQQEPALRAPQTTEVTINLKADTVFLPLATAFVEKGAGAFGMGGPEALALTLAAEEIFAYLCQTAAPGKDVQMRCRSCGYYVDQEFVFQAKDFNMRAFNLTASASFDDEAGQEETGLLIASRMVDRFQFLQEDADFKLILRKDKSYPSLSELPVPDSKPLVEFSVRPPDPEELKIFVHLVNAHYPSHTIPMSFALPGKVVDMAACGVLHAAIAVDKAGHIGGGIVWRWEGTRLVEFYGPYTFNQPAESEMAQVLTDHCIGAIARTDAGGLISRYPTSDLPIAYFEPLGSLTLSQRSGDALETVAYYRDLSEDLGLSVWAHSSLGVFLNTQYERLFFAREIKQVTEEGESASPFAVISAEFDRAPGRVTLHPIWWGRNAEETLAGYVQTLLKEELPNIFFQMDLGKSWHCHFTPALLKCGFEPRLLLPYAGKGDLVIFQYKSDGVPA